MGLTLKEHRDRLSLYLFYGLFFLLPLTVVFGHRGVAPWLLLASLPAFVRGDFWQMAFSGLLDGADWRSARTRAFAALILFCLWVLVSGLWSPQHHYGLIGYVLAPALVSASVIWFSLNATRIWAYRLAFAFAISIGAGFGVLAFEGMSDGVLRAILPPADQTPDRSDDIIALGRGVTALAPALFPAAIIIAMLWGRIAALALVLLGVVAALGNDVAANVVAIGGGLLVAIICFKAPRRTQKMMRIFFIGALLLSPMFALLPVADVFAVFAENAPAGAASSLHRLAIWQHVAAHLPDHMPFGAGADFSRSWKEAAPLIDVPGAPVALSTLPLHPHSAFLQIWLELGVPGVVLFAAFVWYGGRAVRRAIEPVPIIAALMGAATAVLVSFATETSLWQVWRLAAIGLAGMGLALAYKLHAYGWRDAR